MNTRLNCPAVMPPNLPLRDLKMDLSGNPDIGDTSDIGGANHLND